MSTTRAKDTGSKARGAAADQPADATDDAGAAQVQQRIDKETEQGFRGREVDPTPNENYTLTGVGKGLPTPETDPAAALEAHAAHTELASRFGVVQEDSEDGK